MSYSIQTTNAFALLEPAEDDSHAREATASREKSLVQEVVDKEAEPEAYAAGNRPVEHFSNQGAPIRGGHSRGNRSERYYSRGPRDGRGRGRGRNPARGGSQISNGYNHSDATRAGVEQEQIAAAGKDVAETTPHENGDAEELEEEEEEEEEEKQLGYDEYIKEQEEKRKNLNTRRQVTPVVEQFDGMTIRERKEEQVLVVGGKEKNEKAKKERKEKVVLETGFRAPSVDKPRKDFRRDGPSRGRGRYRGSGRRGRGQGRGGRYGFPRLDVEDTNAFPSLS